MAIDQKKKIKEAQEQICELQKKPKTFKFTKNKDFDTPLF